MSRVDSNIRLGENSNPFNIRHQGFMDGLAHLPSLLVIVRFECLTTCLTTLDGYTVCFDKFLLLIIDKTVQVVIVIVVMC